MGLPFPHSVAGGKKGAKRDAGDKPAAKEAAKKAKKEPENASPAGDVEMKDDEVVVGSGRQAAQVCTPDLCQCAFAAQHRDKHAPGAQYERSLAAFPLRPVSN